MVKYNCINPACKMSATCVHAQEYQKVASGQEVISVLNPKVQNIDADGKCQYYRVPQKVMYARGFTGEMEKMTQPVYKAFTQALIKAYSRTAYYDMRNGTKPISPENQRKIIAVASSLGHAFAPDAWDNMEETEE